MKALFYAPWAAGVLWGIALFAAQPSQSFAQTATPQATTNDIRIESIEGRVEVNRGGNTQWVPALPGHGLKPGDRVRTRERSSVSIRWSGQSVVRLPELSDVQIQGSAAEQRTGLSAPSSPAPSATVTTPSPAGDIYIEAVEGIVEVNPGGNGQWQRTFSGRVLKPGDRVRTRERSTVSIHWSDQSRARLPELSDVQILPSAAPQRTSFSLITGLLSFFNRERLTNARFGTRTASAAIRGTEFVLQAEENGRTTLTVIEGEVELSNEVGGVTLRTREQGVAEPGQQPRKTATIIVNNVIQWALYYPAVLDVDELGLTLAERNRLATSLTAYKSGELLRALELLPAAPAAESSAEKIYRAGLLLAVGNVAEAEQVLDTVAQTAGAATPTPRSLRLADALRTLIAAVKLQPSNTNSSPELASEWLAQSYSHQSRGDLPGALRAARKSVEINPAFGFGWARVAELEFSFGHTSQAREALERGLLHSPRNAQALALKGFVLAAQNRISEAISWFNRAITVDANLANAWLGRGLCLIRQGHSQRGREDLLTAVVMEPQRAVLRSYLAKAYTDTGDEKRATHELQIAKDIDPNDPTAWLYSALLNEQENRINEAVRDLEKSQELTGNRHIYRSGLAIDQDRAVRSANLARIYQDAGMFDVAIREASRAVSYDYANYSAHLFLADSYNALRDPKRINLRYETPAESEYLIANLLAPVGAGTLSQTISQHEYSKLFERDRVGVVSSTEYFSNGDWVQRGGIFGTYQNTGYAVDAFYRSDNGQRPNNDFEEREIQLHLKQQVTPQDSLYLRGIFYEAEGGDLRQYYDQSAANRGLRTYEAQEPILSLGYHHEWNPGIHTLFLGSRLSDRFSVDDPAQPTYFFIKPFGGPAVYAEEIRVTEDYHSSLEIYSTELQQIWQQGSHNTILGGRYQFGDFKTTNFQRDPVVRGEILGYFRDDNILAEQEFETGFERISFYGYHYWEVTDNIQLIAGVSYDRLTFPENFRSAPISDEKRVEDQVSPKAGLIWSPKTNTTVRLGYSKALAGANIDQTFLLEPTQVAGFNQAFRSIIPESVAGADAGAEFEIFGISIEQRLATRTYLALAGHFLNSEVERTLGIFEYTGFHFFAQPGTTRHNLDYSERTLIAALNQLVGSEWAFGVHYRLTEAELGTEFSALPASAATPFGPKRKEDLEATLHQLGLATTFNHPSGVFALLQGVWNLQSNRGYSPAQPGDDFWQMNVFLGYRFPGRRAELRLGVLNITDQDYQLNPLTLYNELPRERTVTARLRLSF